MDDSICDEGVEYIGLQTDEGINPNVFENENEQTRNFGFTIEREIGTHAKVSGYLGLKFSTSLKYYISYSHQYIHYETTSEFGGNLYLDVQPNNAAVVALKLGYLAFSPIPGVYISFEPQLVLEFTARLDLALKGFKFTRGYTYETGIGTYRWNQPPNGWGCQSSLFREWYSSDSS